MSEQTISTIVIAAIAAVPATITAVAILILNIRQNTKIEKLHSDVNGRLTELVDATGAQQRLEGREEGRQTEITEGEARR